MNDPILLIPTHPSIVIRAVIIFSFFLLLVTADVMLFIKGIRKKSKSIFNRDCY